MALIPSCISDPNNPKISDLGCVSGNVIQALLVVGAVVAGIYLILSALKYVTSQGDPKELQQARSAVTWAILGLIITLGSIAIIRIAGNLVGYQNILPNTVNIPTKLW